MSQLSKDEVTAVPPSASFEAPPGDDATRISVGAKSDHLEQYTKANGPVSAVAELVWNAFDAEAMRVDVSYELNGLDDVSSVKIVDDGTGIPRALSLQAFGNLGGSWKAQIGATGRGSRELHGKTGKGRFRAFAIGSPVKWTTWYEWDRKILEYAIVGRREDLENFERQSEKVSDRISTGTEVVIYNAGMAGTLRDEDAARRHLAKEFALYLTRYRSVELFFQGVAVNPGDAIFRRDELGVSEVEVEKGKIAQVAVSVIEWISPEGRSVFLCNSAGIPLHFTDLRTHTPGFQNYTAYVSSDYLTELNKDNLLILSDDLHPGLEKLMSAAKEKLREHFRERAAELARSVVSEWKEQRIYPYDGEAKDPVEKAERQVFDIVAVSVNEYLKDFDKTSEASKRFTLSLLRQAINDNPSSIQKILREVVHLPKEKQDEFAQLLEKTTLSAVISASKVIEERLDFLNFIEHLVFDEETREDLLERSQLHRILATETWIFGEQFHLMADDEGLVAALKEHRKTLEDELDIYEPVEIEGKARGILDLMLGRTSRSLNRIEHLVVELKRPGQKIAPAHLDQALGYANAVARDPRFDKSRTTWDFLVVSVDMTERAELACNPTDRAPGHYQKLPGINVWGKRWSQIFEEARSRLKFFQDQLNYSSDKATAFKRLGAKYRQFLPSEENSKKERGSAV